MGNIQNINSFADTLGIMQPQIMFERLLNEIAEIGQRPAGEVGGGLLALDLFETVNGLMVNKLNHTIGFRNSIAATCINIPQKMVEYVLTQARIVVS